MTSIGVSLMTQYFRGPRDLVELGAELDQAGVPNLFVTESINEVSTLLMALALRTSRAMIGSAIAIIGLRHPHTLAAASVQIDDLSGGRLVVGLGMGHHGMVRDKLGIGLDQPLARMDQYIACLRGAMDVEVSDIDAGGEYSRIRGRRTNWATTRHVPIILAALSDGMVRLGATAGDGIMTSLASLDQIRGFRRLLDESAIAAGKQPADVTLYAVIHTCLRPTRDEAREAVRRGIGYASAPYYQREFAKTGLSAPKGVPDDSTIDAIAIAGPLEYARDQIVAFREAGVDVPLLAPVANEPDPAAAYRALLPLVGG